MKAAQIFRKLRELDVPIALARKAADENGEESGIPTPTQAVEKLLRKAARQKAVETFRREYRVWCRANGLPTPIFEHYFAKPERAWRLDICWPDVEGRGGVYLESDGGGWVRGRHHRPAGFEEDQKKRNAAVALGWRPLHCTPQTLYSEMILNRLKQLLCVDGVSGEVPAIDAPESPNSN